MTSMSDIPFLGQAIDLMVITIKIFVVLITAPLILGLVNVVLYVILMPIIALLRRIGGSRYLLRYNKKFTVSAYVIAQHRNKIVLSNGRQITLPADFSGELANRFIDLVYSRCRDGSMDIKKLDVKPLQA